MTQAEGPPRAPRSRVIRLSVTEATVTQDLKVEKERELTYFVAVPASWVEEGSIRPSYRFAIDWQGLQSGQTLVPIIDRLHALVEMGYGRQAGGGQSIVVLSALSYQLLDEAAVRERPWRGASCLRVTGDDRLEPTSDLEV